MRDPSLSGDKHGKLNMSCPQLANLHLHSVFIYLAISRSVWQALETNMRDLRVNDFTEEFGLWG